MSEFQSKPFDEFQWEKELKKDDRRIAAYMQELPRYIDLPSEDELIMKRIMTRKELLPLPGGALSADSPDELFPEEEPSPVTDDWQNQPGSEFYIAGCRLGRMWALAMASDFSDEATLHGTRILCLYGSIMARTWDLINMEEENEAPPTLQIALCKRLLNAVNDLMGEFLVLAEKDCKIASNAELHYGQMLIFRDKILKMLHDLRFPVEKKGKKR